VKIDLDKFKTTRGLEVTPSTESAPYKGNEMKGRNPLLAVCALALLALAGCTDSTAQVKRFASATTALSDSAKAAYKLVDDSAVQRKMYAIASDPQLQPDTKTFDTFFESTNKTEDLAVRLQLLKQLSDYASALSELATTDFRSDVDKASTDLQASLVSLRDTYNKASGKTSSISDQNLSIISTAVDAIGGAIVEWKRQAALRTIIKVANPGVQEAANLIKVDLGGKSALSDYVGVKLNQIEFSLYTAYNQDKAGTNANFSTRLAFLEFIHTFHTMNSGHEKYFADVSKGAEQIGKAHAALTNAAEQDKLTSDQIVKSVSELAAYAKSVNEFYKSLQPSK